MSGMKERKSESLEQNLCLEVATVTSTVIERSFGIMSDRITVSLNLKDATNERTKERKNERMS